MYTVGQMFTICRSDGHSLSWLDVCPCKIDDHPTYKCVHPTLHKCGHPTYGSSSGAGESGGHCSPA